MLVRLRHAHFGLRWMTGISFRLMCWLLYVLSLNCLSTYWIACPAFSSYIVVVSLLYSLNMGLVISGLVIVSIALYQCSVNISEHVMGHDKCTCTMHMGRSRRSRPDHNTLHLRFRQNIVNEVSGPPNHAVQVLARLEQRFRHYSLGHVRDSTLQAGLLMPITIPPFHFWDLSVVFSNSHELL